jgi:hypothetical protein
MVLHGWEHKSSHLFLKSQKWNTQEQEMKNKNRWGMAFATLLLAGLYFFPIWSIALEAPQFPEGLGLNIRIDSIEGKEPQDLQNINTLNHYIGMKSINPESIPELTYIPFIVGFLIVSGFLIALFGNKTWVAGWLVVFILLAVAGLVDFYLWEYDYGHNLDPNAPITIPGMSYQPPLIGSKQLLNIRAVSLPHIGFYFALASMAVAGWVWWREAR